MNPEQIEKIINILQTSGAEALNSYTGWFVASALAWMMFGTCAILAAAKIFAYAKKQDDLEWKTVCMVASAVWFVVGGAIIAVNFPDLVRPDAAATHQLILDIRG